jgi:hypothetical protein
VPTRHKTSLLRPPGRRSWVAVTLLVALTVLPTLVVIFVGQAALRDSAPRQPDRADGPPTVIIDPGPQAEPSPQPSGTAAPQLAANPSRSAPYGVRETTASAADRAESTPCPSSAGSPRGTQPPPVSSSSGTSKAQPSEEPEEDVPGEAFLDRVWDELGLAG